MLLSLFTRLQTFWLGVRERFEDENGAVGTEYALLLFLIAIVFTAGAIALGNAINDKLQQGADCLNSQPAASC